MLTQTGTNISLESLSPRRHVPIPKTTLDKAPKRYKNFRPLFSSSSNRHARIYDQKRGSKKKEHTGTLDRLDPFALRLL